MSRLQKFGGIAAFANVAVAIAMLAVATTLIGPAAMSDPDKLIKLAIHNPMPLLLQDGLKFVSAATSIVLILALASYLRRGNSTLLLVATGFGFCSVLCLLGNAVLSLYAIFQASTLGPAASANQTTIGILALAAIGLDGVWLLLVSWIALKGQQLPGPLCYLGLAMGVLSLVPPLAIAVLLLGIIWSVWIGRVLLKEKPVG